MTGPPASALRSIPGRTSNISPSARGDGRILPLPYPQELNDISSAVARKDSARRFADMIIDPFDEMPEQSAAMRPVMGIALRPHIVGQPYRLRHLRRALAHVAALPEGAVPGPAAA